MFTLYIFGSQDGVATVTTSGGVPIGNKLASLTIGPRGPILLQDHVYLDETAHFDRERIPERVVHAKGSGMKFLIILKSVKSTSFTFFMYRCIWLL